MYTSERECCSRTKWQGHQWLCAEQMEGGEGGVDIMISYTTAVQVQVKSYPAQKTITPRILITDERKSQNVLFFCCLHGGLFFCIINCRQKERKCSTLIVHLNTQDVECIRKGQYVLTLEVREKLKLKM